MTATQSFKIYEVLFRYFKSESDAKIVVQEIETIIDNKFEKEKNQLATKDDIGKLAFSTKEDSNRLELKITELIANQERRFNNMLMWMIGMGVGFTGIIITVFKLITGK